MVKPKVFLASSGTSYALVEWMSEKLSDDAETVEWRTEGFADGRSTLRNLKRNCKECDFAVIFLTKDDYVLNKENQKYAARDNCVFEAGMFIGALDVRDESRCILVSSVEEDALPSDLKGITFLKMPAIANGKKIDDAWCNMELKGIRAKIRNKIREYGTFHYRPILKTLTRDQLVEIEKVGGDLKAGESVVVSSVEPMERDNPAFAMHVMNNVYENIPYHYFFPASGEGAFRWVQLIRSLVVAGVAKDKVQVLNSPPQSEDETKDILKKNKDHIIDVVLSKLSGRPTAGQGGLRIHLLPPHQHVALKICVHNATSENAKCYLRHTDGGDYFVRWAKGPVVKQIVEDLLELRTLTATSEIFCSTKSFNLYEKDEGSDGALTRQAIELAIKNYFPGVLKAAIVGACLSPVP